MKILILWLVLLPILSFAKIEKPKLIVVISIDQFRADYLQKLSSHFIPATDGKTVGGFKYLMDQGAYFSHAEYGLLQNMTGPGHATILTGSFAYQNGIPNNDWHDQETQKFMYCTEDQSHKTIGARPSNPHVGTSPKNLIGTTFGDELKTAYGDSRVISMALKDRSSILMGGHRADLALWFDAESFNWVTSDYYVKSNELPKWVADINLDLQKKKGSDQFWDKKLDRVTIPNTHVPESKYSQDMGLSFPHKAKIGGVSSLLFPMAVEMPVELAQKAIENLKLGQRNATDVLAISFSNHDYVGHQFGPESDEIKETTVLEDKTISKLLNYINQTVPGGLKNTWVVLTADHGVAGNARHLSANKIPAGYINQLAIMNEIENFLTKKYGDSGSRWNLEPSELNFYFSKNVLKEKKLELSQVQDEVAKHLSTRKDLLHGISQIFTGADVRRRTLPPGLHEKQILRTYFEGRSGDLMMIPLPNFSLAYGATTHMTGYSYDRYVPIIFKGTPFKAGLYAGGHVVDIAPTLSFLMGIIPPSNSEGKILEKALILK